MKRALLALWFCCCACGDTGRERVQISFDAVGSAPRVLEVDGARLTLTRADVAFGPAYFCASDKAEAELCEVALTELRDVVVVNALAPAAQPLGVLSGTTGEVRSAMYDYGIYWLLPAAQPTRAALEGHSAILEGMLERAGESLRFRAAVAVVPSGRGKFAVHALRTQHEIGEDGARLTVRFDPHFWVDRLDVDALFALDEDGDGEVVIPPETLSHESILQGMTSRAPAQFAWSSGE